MRKKTTIIVNPISGVGKQQRIEKLLEQNLNHDLFDYTVRYTEHIHHGTLLAREAAMAGADCVVAVGGDGSVNDVVQGIHGSSVRLGIIPCGSGNAMAHTLNLPMQPWLAIRVLNQQHEQTIDSIAINDQYICINAAGVGFDAYVARLMQAAKSRGLSAYTNLMLRAYSSYKCQNLTLHIGDRTLVRSAWILAILNSNRIGYNIAVAPDAKMDDGLMDISIIDRVPPEHLPLSLQLLLTRHLQVSQHVEMFRTQELVVEGNLDKWVDIDGEGINMGSTVRFTNIPNSIHLYSRDKRRPLLTSQS